jgi:membrane protein DedA with SNARE-associated domain/membrane-associated phospholipid phosphatase
MVEGLVELVGQLGNWAYLLIFLAATLESAAFLGLLVPGETLVLLGGFLASVGTLRLPPLIAVTAAGGIIGDSIGYELGRLLGRPWLLRYGRWAGLRPQHLERVDAFFERHGGKSVLLGRFVGFLRALVPFVAGTTRMRYPRFLLYNALGAILWSAASCLLGYFAGEGWQAVERWMGRASAIAGGAIVLCIVLVWSGRWLSRHEEAVRRRWRRLFQLRMPLALLSRSARLLRFLESRLTLMGYLGVYLLLAALALLGAAWAITVLVRPVLGGEPLRPVDEAVAGWLQAHSSRPLTGALWVIASLGSPAAIAGLFSLTGLLLLFLRSHRRLLFFLLSVTGGVAVNAIVGLVILRRGGPARPLPGPTLHGLPSPPAAAAFLVYGSLAVFAVQTLTTWKKKVTAALLACFLIAAIDFSGLYLGLHRLSDVLTATSVSAAWLALCRAFLETLRSPGTGDPRR